MQKENTLVTVIVITYNSSKTVVETLNSIYNQTYHNIELIISDDCSIDNTITICEKWIQKNKDRFKKAMLITTPVNTGTSGNLNRAIHKTSGIWCKSIAADDRLLPDCIEKFMKHIAKNPKQRIIFAKVIGFGNIEAAQKWPFKNVKWLFDNLSARDMKFLICQTNFLPAPSVIIKTDVFKQIGGYDESIPLLEDWPFWVKAVFNGINLFFCNEFVAEYRFSNSSISQKENHISPIYLISSDKSVKYAHEHLSQINLFMRFYAWTRYLKNCGSPLGRVLYFFNIINPDFYVLKTVKRKLSFFKQHHQELE